MYRLDDGTNPPLDPWIRSIEAINRTAASVPRVHSAVKGGIRGRSMVEPGSLVSIVAGASQLSGSCTRAATTINGYEHRERWTLWSPREPHRSIATVEHDRVMLVIHGGERIDGTTDLLVVPEGESLVGLLRLARYGRRAAGRLRVIR